MSEIDDDATLERFFAETLPVVPLLRRLAGDAWSDRMFVGDDPAGIGDFLCGAGPRRLDRAGFSFCRAFCE